MEILQSLNEINLSFAFILGLHLLAGLTLWAEYSTSGYRFIKYAAIAQVWFTFWQISNVWLTIDADSVLAFQISSYLLIVAGLYTLAACAIESTVDAKILFRGSAGLAIWLGLDFVFSLGTLDALRLLIVPLFFAIPVVCLWKIKGAFKFLMAGLQLISGATLLFGIPLLFDPEYVNVGALFYLLHGMMVPVASVCLVILATNLSRQSVAEDERAYRVFFDAIDEVFFEADNDLSISRITPSIKGFGITPEQALGKPLDVFLQDPEKFIASANQSTETGKAFKYTGYFQTDKGLIDCEIECTPILAKTSTAAHFVGTLKNTQERNLLERQFINAQRHESLGTLAGGVAHDFNNILQGIVGHAELLKNPQLDKGRYESSLNAIIKGAGSAGGLCRQLLLYTGTGVNIKEDFDINELTGEVLDILRPSLLDGCRLELALPDEPRLVRGDKSQIGQIILNLVKNANDAVAEDGVISISLTDEKIESPRQVDSHLATELAEGEYLRLVVKDNGKGIPPAIINRIFDPFFSTKTKGHGLGLAAIVGILSSHDGAISVESEPDKGTSFTVWIPLLKEFSNDESALQENQPGISRILLVDDEANLLEVGQSLLETLGYTVETASSGTAALEKYGDSIGEFDLLLTDIKMPGMDGIALMREFVVRNPDLAVILTSGYADVSSKLTGSESLRCEFLGKPFSVQELKSAIQRANNKAAADPEQRSIAVA